MKFKVRAARRADGPRFVRLVAELAAYERLPAPDAGARRRILEDVFSKRRVKLFVAEGGGELIGYALYFFTYSSFLARPTLYLEDVFVVKEHRGAGVGGALLKRCVKEAAARGCGRMEWSVLNWNKGAISFYERLGAKRLDDWSVYRLDAEAIAGLAGQPNI